MNNSVYIAFAKRLAHGSFQGQWAKYTATQLGGYVIADVTKTLKPQAVYMGCVLQAGLGQAPARQALMNAGLENTTSSTTINKICGSGMKAIQVASYSIQVDEHSVVVAGGMESMTNSPYVIPQARSGYRMGHGNIMDTMQLDGLEDAYHKNNDGTRTAMGVFADRTAEKYNIARHEQEVYVEKTYQNAHTFLSNSTLRESEIVGSHFVDASDWPVLDEPIKKVKPEKFSILKPAFSSNGTVTAATSSSIADGAAAVCLTNEAGLKQHNIKPLAKIVGFWETALQPEWFTLAPIGAIEKLCKKIGWNINEVDLFEINEAFAIVPMAAMKELNIPREKINIHGGACVIGHPIGVSGARIVVTLAHALKYHNLRKGIAAVCIGGGEAIAVAIENVEQES